MAYGYWKNKIGSRRAVFHSNFRRNPFKGGFAVAAGLELFIDALNRFNFSQEDIDYLKELKGYDNKAYFCSEFLAYLKDLKFSCDVYAVEEGEIVFAYEPLIRIEGPLIECQLIESLLLNILNFQTLIATKTARICIAAAPDPVFEFGLRRAQGIDGALSASRAAYIGGSISTSNVLAGKVLGIPVQGTQAHSWIMAFESEIDAFEAYSTVLPNNCVFLVDTYSTLKGVENAITVGKKLAQKGYKLLGIRLDSGDLAYLSIEARKLLDQAGLLDTQIIASNELDEFIIRDLKQQGAKINAWGVGTSLVTAKDQPALDGVYKMSALENDQGELIPKIKLSEQMAKMTNPGILQTRRFTKNGVYIADGIYHLKDKLEDFSIVDPFDLTREIKMDSSLEYRDLLVPIFKKGKQIYTLPSIQSIRQKVITELELFHSGIKRFLFPHQYPVGLHKSLYQNKIELIKKIREGTCAQL